ncbi:hypothetical protein [Sphingomonas hankookensis]|uniref:hypothetical protein n=1 Tax=Sphingomonas hankookensis TaxID=563996 RepID=UPI003D30341A
MPAGPDRAHGCVAIIRGSLHEDVSGRVDGHALPCAVRPCTERRGRRGERRDATIIVTGITPGIPLDRIPQGIQVPDKEELAGRDAPCALSVRVGSAPGGRR